MKPEDKAITEWEKAHERGMTEDEKIMFKQGFGYGSVAVALVLSKRKKL